MMTSFRLFFFIPSLRSANSVLGSTVDDASGVRTTKSIGWPDPNLTRAWKFRRGLHAHDNKAAGLPLNDSDLTLQRDHFSGVKAKEYIREFWFCYGLLRPTDDRENEKSR
jgi:hypothetical protein